MSALSAANILHKLTHKVKWHIIFFAKVVSIQRSIAYISLLNESLITAAVTDIPKDAGFP
jgi:hypothetical protein